MPYAMVTPAVLFFIVFTIYPMLDMIVLSFHEYNVLTDRKYVGLKNYEYLIKNIDFGLALKNTFVYTVCLVFFLIFFSLVFAVCLEKESKINAIVQRIMFFPHICSMLAISLVFQWLMDENGLFNAVLNVFKLPGLRWLESSTTALISVVIVAVWKGIGYHTLILLSALKSIPREIIEASEIDGAGPIRKFFKIIVPMLSPQIFLLLITITISSFKVFDSVRILTAGGPGKSTMVVVYYIYLYAQQYLKYGIAAAAGTILILILIVMTIIYFKVVEKKVHYE
ncbi:MAG: sugar ABC transporter permease [Tyzzerella sp.]|nr:sugar ABC transporter permease [Tyzzerella sp.]